MSAVSEIRALAKSLSEEERRDLARELLGEDADGAVDHAWAAAWIAECDQRLHDVSIQREPTIAASDVVARLLSRVQR